MRTICLVAAVVLALALQSPALAHDLGVRGMITASDGEPANDIPGYGVFGHWRRSDRSSIGFAVDQTEYDFEEPALFVGLRQDLNIDPVGVLAEAATFSAWVERTYPRPGGRLDWFWGAGLGFSTLDVPDAAGPLAGGGTFDISTDAGSQSIVSLFGGIHRRLGGRWFFEFALRADQHFADWKLTDRVSGAKGAVGDDLALGGHFGIDVRF